MNVWLASSAIIILIVIKYVILCSHAGHTSLQDGQYLNVWLASSAIVNMWCTCRLAPGSWSLPRFSKSSDLSRLRERITTAKEQLLQLDLSPVLAGSTAQHSKPSSLGLKHRLRAPLYA